MKKIAEADVVIFGGGIAGLWLLNRLRETGLSVILFESASIGGSQTIKSQGIIHGGAKYALQGLLTKDALAMSDMPSLWNACLQGRGEIDLSQMQVLSKHQYLWSPQKFTSKLTGFLASATLSSKVEALPKDQYPAVFQTPEFKGELFSLNELVLDVPSLIRELVKANQDAIYKIEPVSEDALHLDETGKLISTTVYFAGKALDIHAQRFVFTAGAGNEVLVKKIGNKNLAMQRRPLHMVMAKTSFAHPLYAHCLGFGNRPRVTITTHQMHDGSYIWYLGGALAEEGIERDTAAQIIAAKKELQSLFPWLDFTATEFKTFRIDRAEPYQKNTLKPETSFMQADGNYIIGWPTKLALAPKLSQEILKQLTPLKPVLNDVRELRSWPMPPVSAAIWEEMFCKNAN